MTEFKTTILSIALLITSYSLAAQSSNNTVIVSGAMKNVMLKGQLGGVLDLDTISNKIHLYGFGPAEYLTGELLIIDGKSYYSRVITNTTMKVEETFAVKTPFFSYSNINQWSESSLPDNIQTLQQLEEYLTSLNHSNKKPFIFKITGTVQTAKIHVVNLPKGTPVNSPHDSHTGQVDFDLQNEPSEIIGFFSTEHKGIFTHHDTFLHMHLITSDRKKMGHLDEAGFSKSSMKLYLPSDL